MVTRMQTTHSRRILTPESMTRVTTASSMAKAELYPRTMRVKNKAKAQKLAPGNVVMAVGSVKNPMVKAPILSPGTGMRLRYPITPKAAKAAMPSNRTLLVTMRMESMTALECFWLYEA